MLKMKNHGILARAEPYSPKSAGKKQKHMLGYAIKKTHAIPKLTK